MVLSDGGGQGEKENVVVGGQEEHIKEGARKQCRIETVGREEELKMAITSHLWGNPGLQSNHWIHTSQLYITCWSGKVSDQNILKG